MSDPSSENELREKMLQESYKSKVQIGRSGSSAIHGALQTESEGCFGRLPRATRPQRLKARIVYSASLIRLACDSLAGEIEQVEASAGAPIRKADGTGPGAGKKIPSHTGTGSAQPSTEANATYRARAFSARS